MSNPFDQFDNQNPFDRFDKPKKQREEQNFFERVGDDYQSRKENVARLKGMARNKPEDIAFETFNAAGLLNDVIGEGFTSLGRGASAITPDIIETPVKEAGASVLNTIGNLPTFGGGTLAETIPQELGMLEEKHPYIAEYVKGGANLGGLLYAAKPVKGKDFIDAAPKLRKTPQELPKQPVSIKDVAQKAEDAVIAEADPRRKASQKVLNAIKKDFPDDWEQVLKAWQEGDDALIETYGTRLRRLGKGSAQYGSGQARAEKYFDEALSGAPDRLNTAVSQNISPVNNYFQTADDLLAAGQKKAAPLYDEAFQANKSIASPKIDGILDTPAGRRALKKAASVMQNDQSLMGLPDPELKSISRDLAAIGKMDEIQGPIASGLNLRTLDSVKKTLDNEINKLYRAGDSYEAGVLNSLKNKLVKEMDAADITGRAGPNSFKPEGGAYARARATAGDYIKVQNAMETGRSFTKFDPDELPKLFKAMSPAEKDAFKDGVAKSIRDEIGKKNYGANSFNAVFGSPEKQKRLMKVLSPADYKSFEKSLRAENRLFKMRNEILGGSPTTSKAIAAGEIGANEAQAALALAGGPKTTALYAINRAVSKMFDGINDKTANEVASIIYEKNPAKKIDLLQRSSRDVKGKYFKAIESLEKAAETGDRAAPLALTGTLNNQTISNP